jgi:hypothetical protein
MKFNVFFYVVNPVESLPKGRSVLIAESGEMLGTVRVFGAAHGMFFFQYRGPGVLIVTTSKEKAPAALAALQRFPV